MHLVDELSWIRVSCRIPDAQGEKQQLVLNGVFDGSSAVTCRLDVHLSLHTLLLKEYL